MNRSKVKVTRLTHYINIYLKAI